MRVLIDTFVVLVSEILPRPLRCVDGEDVAARSWGKIGVEEGSTAEVGAGVVVVEGGRGADSSIAMLMTQRLPRRVEAL